MNVWLYECMNESSILYMMYGRLNVLKGKRINGWRDEIMNVWMDAGMNVWMHEWMNEIMNLSMFSFSVKIRHLCKNIQIAGKTISLNKNLIWWK